MAFYHTAAARSADWQLRIAMLAELLRVADETIVAKALNNACVALPITRPSCSKRSTASFVLGMPDADGDIFEHEEG